MSMRSVYRKIARQNGVSVKEVKDEMQKALDDAWNNPNKSAECIANQNTFMANGEKPTVDEFIRITAERIKK